VLRTLERVSAATAGPALAMVDRGGRRLISPFSQAMGIELRQHDARSTAVAMPVAPNEGAGVGIDPGALLSLADICAALACLPSLDERTSGSATLSLAAVFGDAISGPAIAVGEQVAEDGGVRSALIRIGAHIRR
jgi:acyl-coenzyme A thioesterase PaaI-like protein